MTVPSRAGLAPCFLRLGISGFGGPIALIEGMHRNLVEAGSAWRICCRRGKLPAMLLTLIPAPYLHRYGKRPWLEAIVKGITAAATEAIVGAVVVMAR